MPKYSGMGSLIIATPERVCENCISCICSEYQGPSAGIPNLTYYCVTREWDVSEPERSYCKDFELDDGNGEPECEAPEDGSQWGMNK